MKHNINLSISDSGVELLNGISITDLIAIIKSDEIVLSNNDIELLLQKTSKKEISIESMICFLHKSNVSTIQIIKLFMRLFNISMSEANEKIVMAIAKQ
jgi:hypothetical protein